MPVISKVLLIEIAIGARGWPNLEDLLKKTRRLNKNRSDDREKQDDYLHGRRKRGVCRGSDTPNDLCGGDIDMYIPLEKPNT